MIYYIGKENEGWQVFRNVVKYNVLSDSLSSITLKETDLKREEWQNVL